MNQLRLFIHQPIAMTLLLAGLLAVGVIAYRDPPFSGQSGAHYTAVQVQTYYPRASSDVVRSAVTTPLEKRFKTIKDIKQMSSHSCVGASVITLRFERFVTLEIAVREVQAAINTADSLLPDDLETKPLLLVVQ